MNQLIKNGSDYLIIDGDINEKQLHYKLNIDDFSFVTQDKEGKASIYKVLGSTNRAHPVPTIINIADALKMIREKNIIEKAKKEASSFDIPLQEQISYFNGYKDALKSSNKIYTKEQMMGLFGVVVKALNYGKTTTEFTFNELLTECMQEIEDDIKPTKVSYKGVLSETQTQCNFNLEIAINGIF